MPAKRALLGVQVMGMVGCLRKRVLLLWQAVEFSRSSERPNLSTLQVRHLTCMAMLVTGRHAMVSICLRAGRGLMQGWPQIARKALEPPAMAEDDGDELDELLPPSRRPLSAGVLRHWSVVRCGCIEGVLATAILAGQHADVWDAASLLLRDHCR
jgi:hypothetical protein